MVHLDENSFPFFWFFSIFRRLGFLLGSIFATTCLLIVAVLVAVDASAETDRPPISQAQSIMADATSSYWWFLINDTDTPVYGEWSVQEGSRTSAIGFSKEAPMGPGTEASTQQASVLFKNAYWIGRICFHASWWSFGRVPLEAKLFTLLADPTSGNIQVEYIDGKLKTSAMADLHEFC